MVGWHHWLNEHEIEQVPRDGKGQGSLACCSPWGHKESLAKSWTWLTTEQQPPPPVNNHSAGLGLPPSGLQSWLFPQPAALPFLTLLLQTFTWGLLTLPSLLLIWFPPGNLPPRQVWAKGTEQEFLRSLFFLILHYCIDPQQGWFHLPEDMWQYLQTILVKTVRVTGCFWHLMLLSILQCTEPSSQQRTVQPQLSPVPRLKDPALL